MVVTITTSFTALQRQTRAARQQVLELLDVRQQLVEQVVHANQDRHEVAMAEIERENASDKTLTSH